MNASGFLVLLALGAGLPASAAMAQELVIPDRQRLQAMSHEEYDAYRKQMRSRIEGANPAEQNLARESGVNGREYMEKPGYGQGYGARIGQGVGPPGGVGGGQGGYGRSGGGGRRR